MSKKSKKTKNPQNAVRIDPNTPPGTVPLQNFAQAIFKERLCRFQKNGSAIDSVYEGLDFDAIRIKRRISSVISVAEEVNNRFSILCEDTQRTLSLAEDWVIMNSCPVSAFDYIEKYVYTTLGAAIWILDHIRDNGKIDKLNKILSMAQISDDVQIPDVWDPCHNQQLLRQMVCIINSRNSDCPVTEKAIRKNKATVDRVYMDRPTAENKIDHSVPSRQIYDQIIALIDPHALKEIEAAYKNKYWEWLERYFKCRILFHKEEMHLRSELEEFKTKIQAITTHNTSVSQNRRQFSILSNATTAGLLPSFDSHASADQFIQMRTLEYQNQVLFDKQEEFNARFSSFTREVGEFSLISTDSITKKYGTAIPQIWEGYEIEDPYSMCMAFLSLLDQGSDLPWCYFPSVILQSCYANMLPWTRTRYIPCCDDIWEHYDDEIGDIVPGPTKDPLSKKIKIPDMDNWYRLQYQDAAKAKTEQTDLYNLSQVLYEATGCLMPRNPKRHMAALNTLNRYGINSKRANQNLLYCMSLLSEARHQSQTGVFPIMDQPTFDEVPDTVEELQAQVISLKEELARCRQMIQSTTTDTGTGINQVSQLQRQLSHRDLLVHDLSSIVFESPIPVTSNSSGFPCRVASNYAVFAADDHWLQDINNKLPDIVTFQKITKNSLAILRKTDTIWVQPKNMPFDEYRRIIVEARKAAVPVRIYPFSDVNSCATLMVHADIAR